MDHEIIDGAVGNTSDVLKVLGRLREALQTLPFLGGEKVIWLKNCSFLGEERVSSAAAVTDQLSELARELKEFPWDNTRLLISASKVDRRKALYKTLEKIGTVEVYEGLGGDDGAWVERAEDWVLRKLKGDGKSIRDDALGRLVASVGPNLRLLATETEKLVLFVGERKEITELDVDGIVTRQKQARAFALAEALGERDLPAAMHALDEELWEMRTDAQKSEIGLLYGLITKVRVLLFLKELMEEGVLQPERSYGRFKSKLESVPVEKLPVGKKSHPLSMHPFVLFKASGQVGNFSRRELVSAMESLLNANLRLISTGTDPALVLQQVVIEVVGTRSQSRSNTTQVHS